MINQGVSQIPIILTKAKSGKVFHKIPNLLLPSSISDEMQYGEAEFKNHEEIMFWVVQKQKGRAISDPALTIKW